MGTDLSIRSGMVDHNTRFDIMWQAAIDTAEPGPYGLWTQDVEGNGAQQVTLGFLANQPTPVRWKGMKETKDMRWYEQTIRYEKFHSTMVQPRDLVENDQTGALNNALQLWIRSNVTDFYDTFVAESFDGSSGAGATGFDDVALFSTAHPHAPSGATQSNLGSGTNLSWAAVQAAKAAGGLMVQENGRPLRLSYNICRVGPRLESRALELFSTDRVVIVNTKGQTDTPRAVGSTDDVMSAATRTNVYSNSMQVIVDHRVTNFFTTFIDNTKGYKPMVLFKVRPPEAISKTEMTDEERFNFDNYVWSVEADFGVAPGHWYSAYRLTGTE